jgi:cytochrome P450
VSGEGASIPSTGPTELAERARFDLPEFYDRDLAEVEAVIADVHRESPVYWCESGEFWVITKLEDQRAIGTDPALFSNMYGVALGDAGDPEAVMSRLPQWARDTYEAGGLSRAQIRGLIGRAKLSLGDPNLVNFVTADPPLHTYQRTVWAKAFGTRLIRGLSGKVDEITDELLGAIEPGGTYDFVEAVAGPLPTLMSAHIMGVPRSDRARFVPWAKAQMEAATFTPDTPPAEAKRINDQIAEFLEYNKALIEKRRADPQDDFTSRVVTAEVDGKVMDDSNTLMLVASLFAGAGDTSKSLIAQMIQALSERPDQRAILLEKPELVNNAVEEVLRYYPIAWALGRTAVEATELRGRRIEKDDYLWLLYLGANRDPDVWERPSEFDLTRTFDAAHNAFGFGEHTCPGANLARMEGRAVLREMLSRFPSWEMVGEPVRETSVFINGLRSMEIRFQ